MIPPCGVPLSVGRYVPLLEVSRPEHVLDEPEEAVVVDLLAEDRQQDLVVDVVETSFDITLDEPLRALPVLGDVLQRGVTAQPRPEAVGVAGPAYTNMLMR